MLSDVLKVSSAAHESGNQMWEELRMSVASVPSEVTAALPIPTATAVVASSADDIGEARPVPQCGST